jgi:hypothetical protein
LPTGQLLNISTRAQLNTVSQALIGGFIITGANAKTIVARAIGPSLGRRGVTGALADPTLQLFDANGILIAQNDNWRDTQEDDIIDIGLQPSDNRESAIALTLTPSSYTAVMLGQNLTSGIGLIEIFDLEPSVGSVLANISSRGLVGTGNNVLIGGFIIGARGTSADVVLRALGPSLSDSSIAGVLQDPTLELHNANGALIAANDNWRDSQESEIQSRNLAPTDNRESAIFASLLAGNYTAIVRGRNATTGVALVEVFQVP